MEPDTFAERLKQLRAQHNLTQKELAEKTGISVPQIVRYESGRSSPRLRTAMRLAHVLGVTAVELSPELLKTTKELELEMTDELQQLLDEISKEMDMSYEEVIYESVRHWVKNRTAHPALSQDEEADE